MRYRLSERIEDVPPSFLREIFKVLADPDIISFAGGLPNPSLFPVKAFRKATEATLLEAPKEALQYGTTEGLPELKEIIAQSYVRKDKLDISADDILITNGSQQGLDLLGRVLINKGDAVVMETPSYLAAIQAFSLYQPQFVGVKLKDTGLDTTSLAQVFKEHAPKIVYTIPNFQNPTGITYTNTVREEIASLVDPYETILIEDDPYGEIRFAGERRKTFLSLTDQTIMLGTFSKIVAPGLRLGWIVAKDTQLYQKLATAKQAADLHTSTFVQHIVYRYYRDNVSDEHVKDIAAAYKKQKDALSSALKSEFGDGISFTEPEGGMFIWAAFDDTVDTAKLFELGIDEGVAFVPGESFFVDTPRRNTMRLNYTNSSEEEIVEGVRRLGRAVEKYKKSTT